MRHTLRLLAASLLIAALPHAANAQSTPPSDQPLRAVLDESKEKNRGVTIYVNGASIPVLVVAVESGYVIGRSRESSRIVIRLDRIDAVVPSF